MYLALKHLHVTCVVVSGCGFFLRGIWMLVDSPWLTRRWMKIAPHVVDTLLLGSAIGLSLTLQQYPFVHAWVTAKVLGLMAYIGLGTVALKRGRTKGWQIVAWLAALLVFAYIVSVARTHDAAGFLNWL